MALPSRAAQKLIVDLLVQDCVRLAQEACGLLQPASGIRGPPPAAAKSCPGLIRAMAPDTELVAPGKKIRVLIVEDEALIALVLAEILEEMGFGVCASEATEAGAVAAAIRHRPDLMIVDARLREGSGIGAVETILRDHFIAHIFLSGDRLAASGLHPRAILLQKPFLEPELALAIRRALGPGPT